MRKLFHSSLVVIFSCKPADFSTHCRVLKTVVSTLTLMIAAAKSLLYFFINDLCFASLRIGVLFSGIRKIQLAKVAIERHGGNSNATCESSKITKYFAGLYT